MKILYASWGYPDDCYIVKAMTDIGIDVEIIASSGVDNNDKILEALEDNSVDILFSVNFNATLSDICQKSAIPYCSWVLAYPCVDLYSDSVLNPCNFIGVSDSYWVEKLRSIGVSKVFYLPDAVEPYDITMETKPEKGINLFCNYKEKHIDNQKIPTFFAGYMYGFLHFQRECKGAYVLEEAIQPNAFEKIKGLFDIPDRVMPCFDKLYVGDLFLSPMVDCIETKMLCHDLSQYLTAYSDEDYLKSICENSHEYIDKNSDLRKELYRKKEFTLVPPMHCSHNAISKEVLEVIVAGGFPLVGMANDYSLFFENEKNILIYHNNEQLLHFLSVIGNDEELYHKVKKDIYDNVIQNHTYSNRIPEMIKAWSYI